jgi:hypothetical protein
MKKTKPEIIRISDNEKLTVEVPKRLIEAARALCVKPEWLASLFVEQTLIDIDAICMNGRVAEFRPGVSLLLRITLRSCVRLPETKQS